MRNIIATRCDICTYVFVRTYKIRTMETIVSINIGSVPDAYSARTIYVSKHVPWKAPLTPMQEDVIDGARREESPGKKIEVIWACDEKRGAVRGKE